MTKTVRARVLDNEWTVSIDGGKLKPLNLPKNIHRAVVRIQLRDMYPSKVIIFI